MVLLIYDILKVFFFGGGGLKSLIKYEITCNA